MTESFQQIAREAAAESAENIDAIRDDSTQLKRELETSSSEHLADIAELIEHNITPLLQEVPEIQKFVMTLAPPVGYIRLPHETVRFENSEVKPITDRAEPPFHYHAIFANHQISPYDRATFTLFPNGQWEYTAFLTNSSPGMVTDWEAGGPDETKTCFSIQHTDLTKIPQITQIDESMEFTAKDADTMTFMLATLAGHIQSGEVAALYENSVLKTLNEQAPND